MSTQEVANLIDSVNDMTQTVANQTNKIDERMTLAEQGFDEFKTDADKRYSISSRTVYVDSSLLGPNHGSGHYKTLDSAISNNSNVDRLEVKLPSGTHIIDDKCSFHGKKLTVSAYSGGNKENVSILFSQTGNVNDHGTYVMNTNGIYFDAALEVYFVNVTIVTPSLPVEHENGSHLRIHTGGIGVLRYPSRIVKIHLYVCHVEINDSPMFAVFAGFNDPMVLSIYQTVIHKKKDIKFIHTNNGKKPKVLANLYSVGYIGGTEDSDFFDAIFLS